MVFGHTLIVAKIGQPYQQALGNFCSIVII